ncbi:hypothetical protein BDP81DRAFT_468965 [Colletotrichum phormii]|uniref:Ankyrin repeat protein n=1 Tax=Colletotrichum phormii TaxID=359342 RepID=A0AAJ0A026_9PEZI|nr:uncharacterized protein BDP81DRAFT_468965 [Colletotrichum phormii]KAK1640053.1 hypothetical protein BDP81DRAFT_468965 [Colletotrichum phormii]
MELYSNPEEFMSRVFLRSSRGRNVEIRNEFADASETCFVRLAAQYAAGCLSLSDYLEGVLSHLRKGAIKHKWDVPSEDFSDLLELDLFAGAVKSRHLDSAFILLEEHDYSQAKRLASRAWATNDPDEFDRLCREDQTDPSALSPEIADLLLIICYARRHTLLFRYLIDEISLWTNILNFGWVHDPVNSETQRFLHYGIRSQDPGLERDGSVAFGSQKLREFHLALASRGIYCDVASLGDYLACCRSLDQAIDFLTVFPGNKVGPSDRGLYEWESGGLVGSIVNSPTLNGKLRTDIMNLALESIKGVDVNALFTSNIWEDDLPGRKRTPRMTGLQVAACKGDRELAKALIRHGARSDIVEHITGLNAAGFARNNGQVNFARWLDGLSQE